MNAEERIQAWVKKGNPKKILDLTKLKLTSLPPLLENITHVSISHNKIENLDTLIIPKSVICYEC